MRPTREAPLEGPGLFHLERRVRSGRCFPEAWPPEVQILWRVGSGGSRRFLDCFHLDGELVWVIEDVYLDRRRLEDGVVGE